MDSRAMAEPYWDWALTNCFGTIVQIWFQCSGDSVVVLIV